MLIFVLVSATWLASLCKVKLQDRLLMSASSFLLVYSTFVFVTVIVYTVHVFAHTYP